MNSSPIRPVARIDPNRPYIVMTQKQWYWAKVNFGPPFKLNYRRMPKKNTSQFILLEDLRGGRDGRVWLACSFNGRACVLKFDQQVSSTPFVDKHALDKELVNWQTLYPEFTQTRIAELASDRALVMPYLKTTGVDRTNPDILKSVQDAVADFAHHGKVHADLAWRHVGLVATPKKGEKPKAILYDLRDVKDSEESEALDSMLKKLDLS